MTCTPGRSGVVDHLAADDAQALAIVRTSSARCRRTTARRASWRRSRSRTRTRRRCYEVVPRDSRTPYDVREVIRRIVDGSQLHEFKELYGETLVCGFARSGAIRSASWPTTASCSPVGAEGRALRRAVQPARHPAGLPAEHLRLHGGPRVRERRHRQGRRQAGHRRGLLGGAEVHRGDRRLVRCRQLRDVRAGVRPAVPVDVAERPDLGDGWGAGRLGAGHGPARRPGATGGPGRPRRRRRSRRRSATSTKPRARPTTPPRGCGTTASSTRPTPAGCSGMGLAVAAHAPSPGTLLRRLPDVTGDDRSTTRSLAGRQPRRDRPAGDAHRAPAGHPHRGDLHRPRRASVRTSWRPTTARPGGRATSTSTASSPPARPPRPTPSTPATASCPSGLRSPEPSRTPASPWSARPRW